MNCSLKKGKHSSQLKTIHTDQLTKLQQKHQLESDLLEDIRLFSKQRSIIEKEYAQALIKLGDQFLTKRKFPPAPDLKGEDGQEFKTIWQVWQTVLEESRRVGDMRLQASETYMQQISEPSKPLKTNKGHVAKKVFDQCNTIQKEVSQSVHELIKSHKQYSEEEHISAEARAKATDADAKVKNKSTGIFTSLAKLQQASAKLNTRKEVCEVKSTAARNEYLLNLAVSNAHQERFYNTEMPHLIKTLDGEMYEKTQEFFTALARAELESCGLTQECFMKILTDACLVSRDFNLQCFLKDNSVFTERLEYQYEPQDNDQVASLCSEYQAGEQVEQLAEHWATALVKDTHLATSASQQLQQLTDMDAKSTSESSEGKVDKSEKSAALELENKLDEVKATLRKAETGKTKAEAAIAVLKANRVAVEEHIQKAEQTLSKQEQEEAAVAAAAATTAAEKSPSPNRTETAPKTRSSTKEDQRTDSTASAARKATTSSSVSSGPPSSASGPPSSTSRLQPTSIPSVSQLAAGSSTTYINYEDDDFVDEAFGPGGETHSMSTGYASMSTARGQYYCALYDFQANNCDELSVWEGEQLEVISEVDQDGWVKARNSSNQEGLVPWNYLRSSDYDPNEMNVDGDLDLTLQHHQQQHESPAAGTITTPPTSSAPDQPSIASDTLSSRQSNYSATDFEVQAVVRQQTIPEEGIWVRALIAYEATSAEELSFQAGQLLRVLKKETDGVDDGFWEGELNGRMGLFPSLAVEEVASGGAAAQSATPPTLPSPPGSLPPPPPPIQLDESTAEAGNGATLNGSAENLPLPPPPDCKADEKKQNTEEAPEEDKSQTVPFPGQDPDKDSLSSTEAGSSLDISAQRTIVVAADIHDEPLSTNQNNSDEIKQKNGGDELQACTSPPDKDEEVIAFADDTNIESSV